VFTIRQFSKVKDSPSTLKLRYETKSSKYISEGGGSSAEGKYPK
jgi:hypothetical protein